MRKSRHDLDYSLDNELVPSRVVFDGRELQTERQQKKDILPTRPVSMTKIKKNSTKVVDEDNPLIIKPQVNVEAPKKVPDIVIPPPSLQQILREPSPRFNEQSASIMRITAHPRKSDEKRITDQTSVDRTSISAEDALHRFSDDWQKKKELALKNLIRRSRTLLLQKRVIRRWKKFTKNRISEKGAMVAEKFYKRNILKRVLQNWKRRYEDSRYMWKRQVCSTLLKELKNFSLL
jgi:hypothetical protein